MPEHKFVTLKVFKNDIEAGMLKSLLEAEGLTAVVIKGDVPWNWRGEALDNIVELRVPDDQLEEAREVISAGTLADAGDEPAEESKSPEESEAPEEDEEPQEEEEPEQGEEPQEDEEPEGDEEREEEGGMPPNLVVLRAYESEIEAELARGLLKSEGITSFVLRENAGGWYASVGAVGEVILLVASDEVEAAKEVLGEALE